MKEYKYKNREWLQEQVDIYKTLPNLVKGTGYPETSLKRWCDKFGIKLTKTRQSTSRVTKEFLIEQYSLGKEIRDIAKEFVLSTQTIVKKNKEFNISALDYNPRYLFNNSEWLKEQFDKYKTVGEVSKQTGYPRSSITRAANKFGIYESQYTRNKSNHIKEDYFEHIDSSDKAYFLGFIMADGNIYEFEDGRLQFSLTLKSTDSDILYKFADFVEFDKDKIKFGERYRNDTLCKYIRIASYNKTFCNNLIQQGIVPRKSGTEHIPKSIPSEFIKDFVRGYFDGDGSVLVYDNKATVGCCSSSIDILNDINEYFKETLDISFNISKSNSVYTIGTSSKINVYSICNHLYYKGCISLDRKYNNAQKIIQSI